MVSKAGEDFPEPDSPVNTTSLSRGMVRSMSCRFCWRAPLITIWVCCLTALSFPLSSSLPPCGGGLGWGVRRMSPMDASPHATGLWPAPHPRLGGGRRRQRFPILHRVATERDEPVAEFRRALELQVAGRFLHLAFEILDQALDLVRRQPGRERGDCIFDDFLLMLLEVVDGLHDAGRCDAVFLVVGDLDIATAVGLLDRPLHRAADRVRVHDDVPFDVAGRPSGRLN